MEGSKITEFYRDKNILITGGTGFVGKVLIEKLLRTSEPRALYLLIRPKRSVDPQTRLTELFKSPLFEKLKTLVPDFKSRIIIVPGDIMEEDLGLADADRKVLIDNIDVVFHAAATVKFDQPLPVASKINVIGTKSILQLCKQMKKLQSVVYVSTAFSHCPNERIEESFYDPPISTENLIKLTECLKGQQLNEITPYLLGQWPNTYVFTKAVAEETVKIHGKGLPIAIFRPAIIVSTKSEPVPGWIDNMYGPIGVLLGYGTGIIRVTRVDPEMKSDLVPADMTVNCLIAVGYKTRLCPPSDLSIPIYNFTPHNDNTLLWGDFMRICAERGHEIPTSKTIWYYSKTNCKSFAAFIFMTFLLHIIPALLVDSALLVMNKKPRALKLYRKIYKFDGVLSYFNSRSWDFTYDNVNSLWQTLSKQDQEIYNFDMASLDWNQYLRNVCDGLRLYMLEDKIETIPYAKKKFFILWILHRTVQIIFFTTVAWSFWHLISFARWMVATRC